MRCTILLFAELRQTIGCDRFTIELPVGSSVREAVEVASQQHSAIAAMRGRLAVALNDAWTSMDANVTDGCTIALIPPVSGG